MFADDFILPGKNTLTYWMNNYFEVSMKLLQSHSATWITRVINHLSVHLSGRYRPFEGASADMPQWWDSLCCSSPPLGNPFMHNSFVHALLGKKRRGPLTPTDLLLENTFKDPGCTNFINLGSLGCLLISFENIFLRSSAWKQLFLLIYLWQMMRYCHL